MEYTTSYRSTKYKAGEIFKSEKYGEFIILGKSTNKGTSKNPKYVIRFIETGYIMIAGSSAIMNKAVRDRLAKTTLGIGYLGYIYKGEYLPKEYELWQKIMSRCYNKNNVSYKYYGEKNVIVNNKWHCFKNFVEDIRTIKNYDLWIITVGEYQIDKDVVGDSKEYSLEKCCFITGLDNSKEQNLRNKQKDFKAVRLSDNLIEYWNNQHAFSREHGVPQGNIGSVLNGDRKTASGWTFEYIKING